MFYQNLFSKSYWEDDQGLVAAKASVKLIDVMSPNTISNKQQSMIDHMFKSYDSAGNDTKEQILLQF